MINLDNNYDAIYARDGGSYAQPAAGGYLLVVTGVSEKPSSAGNDMVTLELDISGGEFGGAFSRFPKKFFQLINGEHTPYFKAMIKYFNESNEPHKTAQTIVTQRDGSRVFNPLALVGCVVGGNLRDTEYIHKASGETRVGLEVAFLCAAKDVVGQKVLPLKKLGSPKNAPTHITKASQAFVGPGARAPQADDNPPF